MAERKSVLLRLDSLVHDALARWAADELRSTNAADRVPATPRPERRRAQPAGRADPEARAAA